MKFQLAVNLERMDTSTNMEDVKKHTLDMVKMADQGNFNIVWAAEHHAIEMTIAPNPFQILTWWASHTEKIRLGTAVVNAAYWHPINLAGEAAFTDLISGGRLEFGIGSGAYQREFDRMKPGLKQQDGWRYMQEMLPLLKQLWLGDVEHNGEYWQFPASTSCPKPIQKPHPPIWVAARSPITFDYAIKNECNIMSWPLTRPFSEAELYKKQLDEATANGTNRLMVITAALVASYGYRSKGITTHPWGLYFGIVATFGAIIGARIAIDIDGDTFKRFLAIIMISVGLIIVFRSKSIASLDLPERLSGKYLIGGLIGFFFIGVYGGFLQAGVGIVIMLLLTQINRMNLLRTNSVKAFSVFIYSIAAVLIFALDGKILWMVGFWMVLGSVVGAWLSSRWSVKKGDKVIRITLLIMVSYMAVKLWLDTFNT